MGESGLSFLSSGIAQSKIWLMEDLGPWTLTLVNRYIEHTHTHTLFSVLPLSLLNEFEVVEEVVCTPTSLNFERSQIMDKVVEASSIAADETSST